MKISDKSDLSDPKLAPYKFLMEYPVETWEEFEKFKDDFPDSSDSLIWATCARIAKKHHGVNFLGF
ncbi:hypothetical protein BH10ACI2_BH10ACI2_05670 [soil metagenome]